MKEYEMARGDRNKGGDSKPAEPAKPAPKTLWELLYAMKDDVLKAFGFTVKAGAATVLVGTQDGRDLLGQGFGVIKDGLSVAVNRTEEMVRRKTQYTILTGAHALASLLISAYTSEWGPRIFGLALVFVSLLVCTVLSLRSTARWWLATGAIWKGLEKTDKDKVAAALKGNPLPFLFGSFQPAVEGGLGMLWSYAQFLARVLLHYAIGSLFIWQPFHTNPALLLTAPFVITGFVFLAMGYNKDTKWNLWFVYLFVCLAVMFGISALAWNPWIITLMTSGVWPDGLNAQEKASLTICMILLLTSWYAIQWAAKQNRQHQVVHGNGKGGNGSASSSPRREYNVLIIPAIAGLLFVLLLVGGFKFYESESDGFRKPTWWQNWLAEHNFDQTGGSVRGANAITDSAPVRNYNSRTSVVDGREVTTKTFPITVGIGPMNTPITVQDGDSVLIVVEAETYQVYDDQNNVVTLRFGGSFKGGTLAMPEMYPERMRLYRDDYPSLRQPDAALLGRIGNGELFFVGTRFNGVVNGSGPLRLQLNVPQRQEFRGSFVANQIVPVTVTVKRAQ